MVATRNLTICEDLSSNNALPNLAAYYEAGHRVLITKASEASNYTWEAAVGLARDWHNRGGIQGWYAFLRPGTSGKDQADEFLKLVGPHIVNCDFVVTDVEVSGVNMALVKEFIDRVNERLNQMGVYARGLIYGSPGFFRPNKIVGYGGWRLWLAQYGPTADVLAGFPGGWMLWQYTDKGIVAGSPHPVDLSRMKPWALQPTLRPGDNNFAVLELKRGLYDRGLRGFMVNNQSFGSGTARAVAKLKKEHRLPADAIAGPRVWSLIGR